MTEKTADSKFSEGQFISGYRIQRIAKIDSLHCVLTELVHEATGARHIHLSNSDRENAFGVVFKTVPRNSTGVAHILEHTALCGSQKYPVRDPFFSMLKRSLSTFMNAFTASDWTMYPFATQIEKDYYNLMGVYLDAAFFPVLDELSFMQEGHRLSLVPDPENPEIPRLIFTGVVYNEMKGAMSSPSQVMARSLLNALYPDTTYRFNSGGEPRDIPSLTWQNLKDFHARHYHPSNAWFYTYGNLPLARHLEFISQTVLYRFDRIQPDTDVPSQPRWTSPRIAEYAYALNQPEDISQKHQICLAWLLADIQDTFGILSLALLNEVLLGNAASPLKKALIDSGLGSSLSDGSGLDADNRDIFFSCGLKDVRADDADIIQKIILDTLSQLTDAGIDRDLIESALHQIEFHRKEVVNTPYPHGLRLLLGMTGTWIHGGDPVRLLNIDADIESLRRQAMTESLLENVIKRYFLENPHRVRLTLIPDTELAERERQRESADLAQIQSRLLPEQIQGIIDLENSLQQRQETLENVSCLPTLKQEDIPPDIVKIHETSRSLILDSRAYEQPTAGIVYVSAVAGAGMLSESALPLVPIFCHCLTRICSSRHDYVEISRLIDRYTGGMGTS
ncbi:MAG: insulinase family protein, partial [Desulfatirhabdiaceae bacterium]